MDWIQELETGIGKQVPVVLVGNKVDLRLKGLGEITFDEGSARAIELSGILGYATPFIETSAKEHQNIAKPFKEIVDIISTSK